jgi:hypothetical protein
MELEADRDAAAATLQAPWRLRVRSAGAGQGPDVPQVVPGGGADPRAVGDGRRAGHLHGPAASGVGGLFIDGGCAIWGLQTRGNGERRRRRWLRGCRRVDLPLMRMRDLGAQGADLASARPRRRRRWQAGQRVEKKARRGERHKARGRGFGRTVHHLHLCTSTLHTYVVVEIIARNYFHRFFFPKNKVDASEYFSNSLIFLLVSSLSCTLLQETKSFQVILNREVSCLEAISVRFSISPSIL